MTFCRSIALFLALVCPLLGQTCHGQETPNETSIGDAPASNANGAAEQSPPTLAVPAADISVQAGRDADRLEQIDVDIQPSPMATQIAIEFADQAQILATLRSELSDLNVTNVTARRLDEQRREWNRLRERIDRWTNRADERWRSLQQTRDQLGDIQQRWELTRDAAAGQELPAEVTSRVEQLLTRVDSLQTTTRLRIDQSAEIIKRLADARKNTSEALRQLADLADRLNQRLLRQDSRPLWQTRKVDWLALNDTTLGTAHRWSQDLQAFAINHWIRLLCHLLFLVVLVAFSVNAARAAESWPSDQPELDRARFLLSRPYSLATSFAILPAAFVYGTLPVAVRDIFYLVLIPPMLRLATGMTSRTERIALYGLIGLSALFQVVLLTSEGVVFSRLVLLVLEILAVGVVSFVIWRGRNQSKQQHTWSHGFALTICVAVLLSFFVALVANLLGWVKLSQFLTEGTLLTCQGAILAVLFVRAWTGLWPATLRHGPGRAFVSVRRHTQLFERVGIGTLSVILFGYWFLQTLGRFRLRDSVSEYTSELLAAPFSWADMQLTAGDILRAIAIVVVTLLTQRVLSFFLREELFPRLPVRTSSTFIALTLVKYGMVAVGLAMAGSALGFTATQLTVLFGALGVGIGFGLQNIVSNFVSGLILIFERPIKIGDVVEVGTNWGVVKSIGVRATVVDAFEGSEIVVPNSDLISKEVKNWTLSGTAARVEVLVNVAYGSEPREVIDILRRVALEHEFVFDEPSPNAMMIGFGDNSLNFRMFCWTSLSQRGIVINDIHIAVYDALRAAGIEIPFPQRDLHIRSIDTAATELDETTRDEQDGDKPQSLGIVPRRNS